MSLKIYTAAAIAILSTTAAARATTVTWNGADYTDGTATISVTPFTANTFTGASGLASFGQQPGVPQQVILQVKINGSFETVAETSYGANGTLSSLLSGSSFTGGTITALQLIDQSGFGDQSNDSLDECVFFGGCVQHLTSETFIFSEVAAPSAVTPEPSSFALFGTGLLGLAGVVRKRFA